MDAPVGSAGRPARIAFARAAVYRLLAETLAYPSAEGVALLRGRVLGAAIRAARSLDARTHAAARALAPALADLDPVTAERLYVRTFGHTSGGRALPYEGPYVTTNLFQETHGLADIAGFYRAFGVEPAAGSGERADHIVLELEFMYLLAFKEAYARRRHGAEPAAVCRDAQRTFLIAHLGRWGGRFFELLRGSEPPAPYAAVAALGGAFLATETAGLAIARGPQLAAPIEMADGAGECPLVAEVGA